MEYYYITAAVCSFLYCHFNSQFILYCFNARFVSFKGPFRLAPGFVYYNVFLTCSNYTLCLKKTFPMLLAITRESIVGFL